MSRSQRDCESCGYRYLPGMPFEKQGGTWMYKKYCTKHGKYMDKNDDGTWVMYLEADVDVPADQSQLLPVDESKIVRSNDKYKHVYKIVPIIFPCNHYVPPWAVLVAIESAGRYLERGSGG